MFWLVAYKRCFRCEHSERIACHQKPSINTVFQAVAKAMRCYAGPAWYSYTMAANRERIEGFLRRAVRLGYLSVDQRSITSSRLRSTVCSRESQWKIATRFTRYFPAERNQQYKIGVAGHITLSYLSKHLSTVRTSLPDYYIKTIVISGGSRHFW